MFPHYLPQSSHNFLPQQLFAVLRYPDQMLLDIETGVGYSSVVFHARFY